MSYRAIVATPDELTARGYVQAVYTHAHLFEENTGLCVLIPMTVAHHKLYQEEFASTRFQQHTIHRYADTHGRWIPRWVLALWARARDESVGLLLQPGSWFWRVIQVANTVEDNRYASEIEVLWRLGGARALEGWCADHERRQARAGIRRKSYRSGKTRA